MKKRGLILLSLTTLLPALALRAAGPLPSQAAGSATRAGAPQKYPDMEAALKALWTARNHLHVAATVYGHHRENAERLTGQAIDEVREAISYVETKNAGNPEPPAMATGQRKPQKGYPEMHEALAALKIARERLMKGATDFEGHRTKALEFTNQAIDQCLEALKYVNSKP